MTGPTPGELASQCIAGQQAAQRAISDLTCTTPPPDLLNERLQAVLMTDEPERLRAFMRTVQKRLEAHHA